MKENIRRRERYEIFGMGVYKTRLSAGKEKINDCKNRMRNAASYQIFRDAWMDVKKETEYMYGLL